MEYKHLMSKVRDAAAQDDPGGMSLGEALTVALVLNRSDWLAQKGYTIAEALDRIDEDVIPLLRKAERTWREECEDNKRVQHIQAQATSAAALFGAEADDSPIHLNGELITYSEAPGYRNPGFVFDVSQTGPGRAVKHRIELRLRPQDAESIVDHLVRVHQLAWRSDNGPLDRQPGEQRPAWLDRRGGR
ncbi:hypothetical protein [Achromobacter xylosoxidans]|uniref:hypothetical protein n=1 Tax=Alcaligenes xylosoxydans xylosoxydans TaxID=85698 RepID=UPI0008A1C9D7|nr:hypothetical protein [Achromobacter xylosoxidans]